MATYETPFEDVEQLFKTVIREAHLENDLVITVISNNAAKKIFEVQKASDLVKFRTEDDVFIIINETIFEQLTEEQQRIIAEQAVTYISYDSDKGKVVITKPDFIEHTGILEKFGFEKINVLKESIKSLYDADKEKEAEDVQTTTP